MLPDHIESNLSVYVARRTSRGKPEISSVDFAHYSKRGADIVRSGNNIGPPEICQVFFAGKGIFSSAIDSLELNQDCLGYSSNNL